MGTTATRVTGPLTPAQLAHYDEHGYLVLRAVFAPAEAAMASMEADRLLGRKDLIDTANIRCRWKNHCDTGECLFECFDPVADISPLFDAMARDPRLLAAVSALYAEPAHLFKEKLILKPPGAEGYEMHQDYISWKDFPRSFVTAAVAIDPSGPDNGCTVVFPGYHRSGYLSPEDGDYHGVPAGAVDPSAGVPLVLARGDVALFGCFTPHSSAPNRTPGWRRLLYASYNADSDGGDRRDAHYREFHAWLRVKYAQYGKTEVYFR
jgi:ectoine hydroxylase-related dioxygenase (phytanoyl-CoA dioxygenase family)